MQRELLVELCVLWPMLFFCDEKNPVVYGTPFDIKSINRANFEKKLYIRRLTTVYKRWQAD